MDVTQKSKKIAIIFAYWRQEPILEEVPSSIIPLIEGLGITGQKPLHYVGYRRYLLPQQQVKVIWHEAVGVELESEPLLSFPEKAQKIHEITIPQKYRLPIVAAGHGMIDSSNLLNSERPRHTYHTRYPPRKFHLDFVNFVRV